MDSPRSAAPSWMRHDDQHSWRHYPPPGFGATLERLRRRRGWAPTFASRKIGIPRQYLWLLEQGRRSPSRSVALDIVAAYRPDEEDRATILAAARDGVGRDWTPEGESGQ